VPKPPIEAQPLSDALAPATMKARRVIDMGKSEIAGSPVYRPGRAAQMPSVSRLN
jgi:hypothetical protein